MGQRVLTHDPSTFFSCDPMAKPKILAGFQFGQTYLTALKAQQFTGIM
jgi:hypothetical protein